MPNTPHPCPKSCHCEGTPRPRRSVSSSHRTPCTPRRGDPRGRPPHWLSCHPQGGTPSPCRKHPLQKSCHCEPVTDVTGVAIRILLCAAVRWPLTRARAALARWGCPLCLPPAPTPRTQYLSPQKKRRGLMPRRTACQNASQSSRPQTRKVAIIFSRHLCVRENTSQAASVKFVRP